VIHVISDDLLKFPVPAGCQNGVSDPRNRVFDGGGALDVFWKKRRTPEVFRSEALCSPKGSVGGHTGGPHHPWARPRANRALGACGHPVPPLCFIFWLRGSSGKIEFLEFFWNFPETLTFCTKTRHQGNSAENSVSPC
jgi:hypothetical protein